jgi:ABC-type multidrug transport system permease subunit
MMTIIREIFSVVWEEWVIFKHSFLQITIAAVITPLLYIITFGWGMGGGLTLEGVTYIKFLIPGVIALSTMNNSYRPISISVNSSRLYNKTIEQFLVAPISTSSYVSGKTIAGAFRGFYAGLLVILISFAFQVNIHLDWMFFAVMFLNGLVFGALGLMVSLFVKSRTTLTQMTSFVILPMTFLCGTFFSTNTLPTVLRNIIYIFPLTHASTILRAISNYEPFYLLNVLVLAGYFVLFFGISLWRCQKIST